MAVPLPSKPAKTRQRRAAGTHKSQLNPRQALFVKLYTDPKSASFSNAYQSAIAAGYGEYYAKRITADLSEKVRMTMAEELEAVGATRAFLARKHFELLNKKEVVIVRTGRSNQAVLTKQPDTHAVRAGLDMAYKLQGAYAAEKHEHTGKDGADLQLIFTTTPETPTRKEDGKTSHQAQP